MARIRTHKHNRSCRLRAPQRRGLYQPPGREPRRRGILRQAVHDAVERRHHHFRRRQAQSHFDGGIRSRQWHLCRRPPRPVDRPAQSDRPRHWRHHGKMRPYRRRQGACHHGIPHRKDPQISRLPHSDAGFRNRRNRHGGWLHRLGRCRWQAARRSPVRWRRSRPGGLWPRRHRGHDDRRQPRPFAHRSGELRRW